MGAEATTFGFHETSAQCAECGSQFMRHTWQHRFCSERCKERWHRSRNPAHIANNRARCARWAIEKRGVETANPWLLGAPPFEEYLPGGGVPIAFDSNIVFHHRQLSALHGVITSLTGEHDRNVPKFVLVPWHTGCRWGALLRDEAAARQLAGTSHRVRLGDGEQTLRFGPLHRILAPKVTKRGHRKLRVDAVTPVCVRCTTGSDGTHRLYTAPTSGNLLSTLALMIPKRIGLLVDESTIRLDLIERSTVPSTLSLSGRDGRLGNMRGWVGHVIVDCNAVGHWLLAVAERIGLGGTTSFGFGRIKVTEL